LLQAQTHAAARPRPLPTACPDTRPLSSPADLRTRGHWACSTAKRISVHFTVECASAHDALHNAAGAGTLSTEAPRCVSARQQRLQPLPRSRCAALPCSYTRCALYVLHTALCTSCMLHAHSLHTCTRRMLREGHMREEPLTLHMMHGMHRAMRVLQSSAAPAASHGHTTELDAT
jgi:hypothetical protein